MKKATIIIILLLIFFLGGGYVYNSTIIPDYNDSTENLQKSSNPSNILNKIESKEQGIYYFGFKQCPWCRELLPVLNKTLNENNVTAYTVDTKADYFLEKDRLEKIFSDITKEKELTVPFVIFINSNGNIQYNIGTVDNHFADKKRLTNKQSKELTSNLNDLITFSLE